MLNPICWPEIQIDPNRPTSWLHRADCAPTFSAAIFTVTSSCGNHACEKRHLRGGSGGGTVGPERYKVGRVEDRLELAASEKTDEA